MYPIRFSGVFSKRVRLFSTEALRRPTGPSRAKSQQTFMRANRENCRAPFKKTPSSPKKITEMRGHCEMLFGELMRLVEPSWRNFSAEKCSCHRIASRNGIRPNSQCTVSCSPDAVRTSLHNASSRAHPTNKTDTSFFYTPSHL